MVLGAWWGNMVETRLVFRGLFQGHAKQWQIQTLNLEEHPMTTGKRCQPQLWELLNQHEILNWSEWIRHVLDHMTKCVASIPLLIDYENNNMSTTSRCVDLEGFNCHVSSRPPSSSSVQYSLLWSAVLPSPGLSRSIDISEGSNELSDLI